MSTVPHYKAQADLGRAFDEDVRLARARVRGAFGRRLFLEWTEESRG